MTNKELSQSIRNELKNHGYTSKAVGVSVKDCGYSTSVHVKIKSPEVSRKEIENLLNHRNDYERDERTYEILNGGNTYIFVDYEIGIFDEVAQEWAATALGAIKSKTETTKIFDGLYLINFEHSGSLQIRQQDGREHCTFNVYDFKQLCEFIYKFSKFGSIAA